MTVPRRSGPSPAILLLGATVIAVLVFLLILAIQGPDLVAQLEVVWSSFFPPDPTTSQGRQIDELYTIVFVIAAAIFLFVEGLIVVAVVRYRRKPGDTELPPQIHGNNTLEIVWTIVPTVIVIILFFLSWQTLNSVDARTTGDGDVRIRAVAQRFQWTFDYLSPDGGQVLYEQIAPEMVVPAGQTVHLTLRGVDVIHAFYVPQFLFKRDVIPGRDNQFDFTVEPEFAGQTFHGQCAELCGPQHWAMQFSVKALAPAEYEAWLKEQIDKANASPSPAPSGQPGPSGSPGPGPSGSPGPTPSGQPGGTTLELSASDQTSFDKKELEAPANVEFTIDFTNNQAGIGHNVEIKDGSGKSVFQGEIFQGVDSRNYAIPPLAGGEYEFNCTVHPNMTGSLTVK